MNTTVENNKELEEMILRKLKKYNDSCIIERKNNIEEYNLYEKCRTAFEEGHYIFGHSF